MVLILAWLVVLLQLMQLTLLELELVLEESCLSPAVSLYLSEQMLGPSVPMGWNQMYLPVVLAAAERQADPMGIEQVVAVTQPGLDTPMVAPTPSTLEFRHLQSKEPDTHQMVHPPSPVRGGSNRHTFKHNHVKNLSRWRHCWSIHCPTLGSKASNYTHITHVSK